MERVADIAYDRVGVGSGDPLLLIHGTGGTHRHWRPVVDRLAKEFSLLLVDLPGHGDSPSPPPGVPHNPIGYADALASMLDALKIDRAHCVGNSVGAWTALEIAKLDRAATVVAIGPAGLWPKRDPWRCVGQLWAQHKMGRMFAPLVPTLMRSPAGRTILLRGTVARPRQMPAEAAIEMATEFANTPDFDAHLASTRRERFRGGRGIDVPVTVAWGEKERLVPPKARRIDELPEHARVVALPGCGHSPMWDDPALVASMIIESAEVEGAGTQT